jgi:tetratricopeptide (TPR) repeat protein
MAMFVLVAAVAVSAASAADRVRTKAGIGLSGEIQAITDEGFVIKVGATRRTVALEDVVKVDAEAFPDLARAEDAYQRGIDGDAAGFKDAERLYNDLPKRTAPAWLRTLVQYRMYRLYAESGRIALALDAFLDIARTSPAVVGALKLPAPQADAPDNKAMLEKVDKALPAAAGKPYEAQLKTFRLSLAMMESSPEDALKQVDALIGSAADPNVRASAMRRRLELLLDLNKADEAAAALPDIVQGLGDGREPDVAYWTGRVLQVQGKHVEAALELMKLPILYPQVDRKRTADALWRAGQAMEAAKAGKDEVVSVYTEAVKQYVGTPGAENAQKELARLGAK